MISPSSCIAATKVGEPSVSSTVSQRVDGGAAYTTDKNALKFLSVSYRSTGHFSPWSIQVHFDPWRVSSSAPVYYEAHRKPP